MPVLSTLREDIDAVFQHDPAARTTLEVVLALSRPACDLVLSGGQLAVAARSQTDRAPGERFRALDYRHRNPSGREDRAALVYRSRHGRRHRRDRRDRRRRAASTRA